MPFKKWHVKKLTKKQSAFIKEYLGCGMIGEAARRAGYSKKGARACGSRVIRSPAVLEEMQRIVSEESAKLGIDSYYVLSNLKHVVEEWKKDKKGDIPTNSAIKTLELLGKHLSLFNEGVDVNVKRHEDWLQEIANDKKNSRTIEGELAGLAIEHEKEGEDE